MRSFLCLTVMHHLGCLLFVSIFMTGCSNERVSFPQDYIDVLGATCLAKKVHHNYHPQCHNQTKTHTHCDTNGADNVMPVRYHGHRLDLVFPELHSAGQKTVEMCNDNDQLYMADINTGTSRLIWKSNIKSFPFRWTDIKLSRQINIAKIGVQFL